MDTRHPFDHDHLRHILGRAQQSGRQFVRFGAAPGPGDVILRHDLDNSIQAAVTVAEIEASLDISATFFVMLRSPNYNVLSLDNMASLRRIITLGHEVGLHFDANAYATREWNAHMREALALEIRILEMLIERPVGVCSLHNPDFTLRYEPWPANLANAYAKEYTVDCQYFSESNFRWKPDCPCEFFESDSYAPAQILIHPYTFSASGGDEVDLMASFLQNQVNSLLDFNVSPSRSLSPRLADVEQALIRRMETHVHP